MNTLFEVGLTNAIIATVLAIAVWTITRLWRHPVVVHALWIIVLIKLVTPPIVAIPWPTLGGEPVLAVSEGAISPEPFLDAPVVLIDETALIVDEDAPQADQDGRAIFSPAETPLSLVEAPKVATWNWRAAILWLWLSGSALWLGLSALRVFRFHRALHCTAAPPRELEQWADEVAAKFEIGGRFRLRVTEGRLSPLVWPIGRPTIVLSRRLIETLSPTETRTLLAHEFAHLRRKDHWVRWLELATSGIYWWHPVVWWARRAIRHSEERACDAWAVWAFPDDIRSYAAALFKTVQFTTDRPERAPLVASRLGTGGNLKERIEHIMNKTCNRQLSWRARVMVLISALVVLPWTLQAAQPGGLPQPGDSGAIDKETVPLAAQQGDAPSAAAPLLKSKVPNSDSDEELAVRREQIAFLEQHSRKVTALYKEGLRGGDATAVSLANYELATAQGELALAEKNPLEALAFFKQAQTHAEQGLAGSQSRYDAGTLPQEVLLQAARNLADAKRRVLQLQAKRNETPTKREIGQSAAGAPAGRSATENPPTKTLTPISTGDRPIVRGQKALRNPADEYRITFGQAIVIRVIGVAADHPIADTFSVEPGGTVALGPNYGRVKVGGMTIDEAENALREHLAKLGYEQVSLQISMAPRQNPAGVASPAAVKLDLSRELAQLASPPATDSLSVLKRIVEAKTQEYERVKALGGEGAVRAAEVDQKRAEVEISLARLEQAQRALESRKLLVELAMLEHKRAEEANRNVPGSISVMEVERLRIMVQLAEARFRELAE